MFTSYFGYPECLDIYCMAEVLNHFAQFSVHIFDLLWVGRPTNRSRCDHQCLQTPEYDRLLPLT